MVFGKRVCEYFLIYYYLWPIVVLFFNFFFYFEYVQEFVKYVFFGIYLII